MKLSKRSVIIVVVALAALLLLIGTVSASTPAVENNLTAPAVAAAVTPIPWAANTSLPEYIGAPAKAHPLAPARVPQNPFLAPNPFNYVHNDAWASDVYDIAGPLGRDPAVLSTTLAEARRNPSSIVFGCSGDVIDSHGRLILSCTGPGEWSLVMVDPATLEVLTYMYLPVPVDQASSWATAYLYLDNNDRVIMPVVDGNTVKIMVVQTLESAGKPHFEVVGEGYDITSYIGPGDNINGLMADWQGRIWFVVRTAATVGVLDPTTGAIKTLALEGSITNGFAMDRDAAYIVTTAKMYRVEAGRDGVPYKVWEEGYENVGFKKPGQLSAGSGTTPTILGKGKYVAITDNADQLHVMVYRTDAQLTPGKQRILCEVPVFKAGAGADENSLIGSGLSLVAYNAYGNDFDKLFVPPQPQKNEPGVARVDIDPNGKGCTKVWENDSVTVSDEVHKLSTKTGLIYAIGRKWDTQVGYSNPNGLDVYYLTAIEFRTGEVVWERLLGTGFNYDGFENVLIGPTGTAYISQYGGLISIKDSN